MKCIDEEYENSNFETHVAYVTHLQVITFKLGKKKVVLPSLIFPVINFWVGNKGLCIWAYKPERRLHNHVVTKITIFGV